MKKQQVNINDTDVTNVNDETNDEQVVETTTESTKETKSAMIRRMFFNEGMTVNDIHKTTGILYQMVRNIVRKEQDARELAQLRNQVK